MPSRRLSIALIVVALLSNRMEAAVRLKDVASIQGQAEVQIIGYGLVVGLNGAGDGRGALFTPQALANLMSRMNLNVDPTQLRVKNVAAVMVTTNLSPFARVGSTMDVTVSSIGDATSLEGGILLLTHLASAEGEVYVEAQGSVSTGGFNIDVAGGGVTRANYTLVGRVPGGGTVVREIPTPEIRTSALRITLSDPDYMTAARMARSIDQRFGERLCTALDAGTIEVQIPRDRRDPSEWVEFIAEMEAVTVVPDVPARVVLNERTGTIVVGEDVTLSHVAIAHGGLRVVIPPTDTTQVVPQAPIFGWPIIQEIEGRLMALPEEELTTVGEIAAALNALGVTPRDMISIFQALKQAGALRAELIIM